MVGAVHQPEDHPRHDLDNYDDGGVLKMILMLIIMIMMFMMIMMVLVMVLVMTMIMMMATLLGKWKLVQIPYYKTRAVSEGHLELFQTLRQCAKMKVKVFLTTFESVSHDVMMALTTNKTPVV